MADTAALTMVDTDFVQKLNEMNLAQIALAKVAQTHAGRSDLANLSTTITKDLTGNQDRLTALAAGHGITLTTRPTATDEKAIAQLQKLHGTGFDRAYAHALSGNTARMTPIINSEIATTKNTDLSKLASDTRTMLAAYQNGI